MLNALLPYIVSGIALIIAVLFVIIGINAAVRGLEARLLQGLASFLSSPGKDQPAPVEVYAEMFAHKIVTSLSGSLMGVRSGMSKEAKMLEREAKEAYIDGSPVLSLAKGMLPGLSKTNPMLLGLIDQIGGAVVSRLLQSKGNGPGPGKNGTTPTQLSIGV